MRVIAGKARRLRLVTPAGDHTRPTSDQIKETLFNILQPYLVGCRFLDLFSGSGGIAIEALSRGAAEAVLVDNDREAIRCIQQNIKTTHMEDFSRLMTMDVFQALRQLDRLNVSFDIIFMDPPYKLELERRLVPWLVDSSLVHKGTWIIAETPRDISLDFLESINISIDRIKVYKTNQHIIMQVNG